MKYRVTEDREFYPTMDYTHEEYRSAGVAHVKKGYQECEFYYRGKLISEEEAQQLVSIYKYKKRK